MLRKEREETGVEGANYVGRKLKEYEKWELKK
jgi:hypothetical protein